MTHRNCTAQISSKNARRFWFYVVFMFVGVAFLRTLFCFLFREAPFVTIDESLYTNIARSLAWEGKLAYRGQPINYPYLFYPLLLVPLYWLQSLLGGDIYRMVQIYNTLLICSSVFPVFLFARDFFHDEKKALICAGIAALMPDMIMGAYEMSECVIWPLSLWMVFFGYRMYAGHGRRYGYLTALFTGCLFFTKPGAVAMGAVLLLAYLIETVLTDRKRVLHAALPILLLVSLIVAEFLLYKALFSADSSLIGLYDKQKSSWKASDIFVAIEAAGLTLFLFLFACGGIFGLLPLAFIKDYDRKNQHFIIAYSCGVFAAIIGTAIFVVPYGWDGSLGSLPLHLRYCSMFIPAYIVFALGVERARHKAGRALPIFIVAFILLCIFPGARSGFVTGGSTIDSLTLNAFRTTARLNGELCGTILTVLTILFLLFLLYMLEDGWKWKNQQLCLCFFALFLLFNNVCGYINANVEIDKTISSDAREINSILMEKSPCLGITQRDYDDIYSYWLESRLNKPMQQVTIDQMVVSMLDSGGIYAPFVPIDQPPNVGNDATPDTDTFILGKTIAEHLEISDSVNALVTSNGHFTVLQIPAGKRWVDSMMYGLREDILYAGTPCMIHFFDEEQRSKDSVTLHITAYGNGVLKIGDESISLSAKENTYTVTVPLTGNEIQIASDQDVAITRYDSE